MKKTFQLIWSALISLRLTVVCLAVLIVLVLACTFAQVKLGTMRAVEIYIRNLWLWAEIPGTSYSIPVFPGGGLVGLVLLVNLIAAQGTRLERSWRKLGIWIIHFGLIILFIGEFVTGFFQIEAQMPIFEGQTRSYTERPEEVELAVVDTTAADKDRVYAFHESLLERSAAVEHPELPFRILLKRYYKNSELEARAKADAVPSMANTGPGAGLVVFEQPPVTKDDAQNVPSAFIELINGDRTLGTWLVSTAIEAPQELSYMGRTFRLSMRHVREYLPYSLTLKDFKHDLYPGTDIPKNFSSLVRLVHPAKNEDREVLIYMNSPLRYEGKAFFQASFGQGDTLSVLQVVANPGWQLPYVACVLVSVGLLLHFLQRLRPAIKGTAL